MLGNRATICRSARGGSHRVFTPTTPSASRLGTWGPGGLSGTPTTSAVCSGSRDGSLKKMPVWQASQTGIRYATTTRSPISPGFSDSILNANDILPEIAAENVGSSFLMRLAMRDFHALCVILTHPTPARSGGGSLARPQPPAQATAGKAATHVLKRKIDHWRGEQGQRLRHDEPADDRHAQWFA